jgi:DNA-binding SARP family transcriptional activator
VHQDRPTRRDVLMALQWPDHSHNSARNNLNVALYSLRNTLDGLEQGAQPIVYRDGCYILNPDLTCTSVSSPSAMTRVPRLFIDCLCAVTHHSISSNS